MKKKKKKNLINDAFSNFIVYLPSNGRLVMNHELGSDTVMSYCR